MSTLDLSAVSLKSAYDRFLEANEKWNKEMIAKEKVRFSGEYLKKVNTAEQLMEEAAEMLEDFPDSSKELDLAKKNLRDELASRSLTHYESVKLKFKKQKSVDKSELLKVIDGDIDLYISLSNVTQVSLVEHAKGSALEKELLDCIKESQVPSEIELVTPEK